MEHERIGQINVNNNNDIMEIIAYNSYSDCTIRFSNGLVLENQSYGNFKTGGLSVFIPGQKSEYYVGLVRQLKNEFVTILEYTNENDVIVEFSSNSAKDRTTLQRIKHGLIHNPYSNTLLSVACMGEFAPDTMKNGKHTRCYQTYLNMIQRVYDFNSNSKYLKTYFNVSLDQCWLNFATYAKWFEENYYDPDGKLELELDKDLLARKGTAHKMYGPKTCVFVPSKINMALVSRRNVDTATRQYLPMGISKSIKPATRNSPKRTIYKAAIRIDGVLKAKTFDDKEDAFAWYRELKLDKLKNLANEYKKYLPKKVYDALLEYDISIND